MAGGLGQYLQDTRMELRHVAWPTRLQTIVYAVLVGAISVVVALYLGFFDFLFSSGLLRLLAVLPSATPTSEQVATTTAPSPITITPVTAPAVPTPAPLRLNN